ncbi:hypothetical protein JCM30204_23580 [Dysgonomonas termitidis]
MKWLIGIISQKDRDIMKKYANKILAVMIAIVVVCIVVIVYKLIDILTASL